MVTHTASTSEVDYLEHGLERDPFPPAADDILFQTPESTALVQTLRELIAGNQKTVLVTGPAGSGKSTLAEYLENHPEENWRIKLIHIENDMDREALAWRMVQLTLPEKASKPAMAIPMLHKYLELSSHAGFFPVFILDDADRLTADTLQFVLELATLRYAESLYRFVLCAEQSIMTKLADPSLQELVASGVQLQTITPFNRQQTGEYIELRLKSAGEGGSFSFDDKKIDAIHRITGGLPGPINLAARKAMQALLTPVPKPAMVMTEEPVPALEPTRKRTGLVAAIVAIAVIGFAGWLYLSSDSQPPVVEPVVIESVDDQVELANESEPVVTEPTDRSVENSNGASEVSVAEVSVPAEDNTAEEDAGIETAEESSQVQDAMPSEPVVDATAPDITGAIIAEAAPDAVTGTVQESAADEQTTDEVEVAPSVEPAPAAAVVETPAPASQTYSIDEANIYNLETVPALLAGMRGNRWYREQSRTAYTLQLISASNIDNVLELIEAAPQSPPELSLDISNTHRPGNRVI